MSSLHRLGIALLVAAGLAVQILELRRVLAAPPPRRDVGWFGRFAGVLPHLPARGALGYLFDARTVDLQGGGGVVEAAMDLLLAANAVCPRYLDVGPVHEYVLGDFTDPAAVPPVPAAGYEKVFDGGNGVVLWRRR